MSFGTIIKELRRERDLTQEGLAEILSISPQAISRWETDIAMPDISLLSTLCNYFGVSADMLLGIDVEKKRVKINALLTEAQKFWHRGYLEEARGILEAGLRDYPDSCELMNDLMYISFWQRNDDKAKTEYCDEAIRLGEYILEKSTSDRLRQGAIQVLCSCYRDTGRLGEAVKLANNMPFIANSNEILLSSIQTGDDGYRAKQSEANKLLHFLVCRLGSMQEELDSGGNAYTDDELALLGEKQIALLNLFFEDGNFGFYHTLLWNTHMSLATYYCVKNGDIEKALENIRAAAKHAIGFVTSESGDKYTSLVFRGMERGLWCGSDTDNDAARLLKILDDRAFDGLRGRPEFADIKSRLSGFSGRWEVK